MTTLHSTQSISPISLITEAPNVCEVKLGVSPSKVEVQKAYFRVFFKEFGRFIAGALAVFGAGLLNVGLPGSLVVGAALWVTLVAAPKIRRRRLLNQATSAESIEAKKSAEDRVYQQYYSEVQSLLGQVQKQPYEDRIMGHVQEEYLDASQECFIGGVSFSNKSSLFDLRNKLRALGKEFRLVLSNAEDIQGAEFNQALHKFSRAQNIIERLAKELKGIKPDQFETFKQKKQEDFSRFVDAWLEFTEEPAVKKHLGYRSITRGLYADAMRGPDYKFRDSAQGLSLKEKSRCIGSVMIPEGSECEYRSDAYRLHRMNAARKVVGRRIEDLKWLGVVQTLMTQKPMIFSDMTQFYTKAVNHLSQNYDCMMSVIKAEIANYSFEVDVIRNDQGTIDHLDIHIVVPIQFKLRDEDKDLMKIGMSYQLGHNETTGRFEIR